MKSKKKNIENKMDKKRKVDLIYHMVIVGLLAIMAFSAWRIGLILWEYHKGTAAYEEIQKIAGGAGAAAEQTNFDALRKKNPDIRAWLYSEGTPINYPVVQGVDNQYYLDHMFNGEYNGKGSLFIDYRCEKPFEEFNTIIYGHRMKDGSMFHELIGYQDRDYFEEHPVMALTTPGRKYDLQIFAVVIIPADSKLYRIRFSGKVDREAYLDKILAISEVDTGISVSPEDHIVMLSTCTYEYDDARLVVYDKLSKSES